MIEKIHPTHLLNNERLRVIDEKRAAIAQQLAILTTELCVIHNSETDTTPPIRMRVRSSEERMEYDKYTYGWENIRPPVTFDVTANDLELIYLAVLANQPTTIAGYHKTYTAVGNSPQENLNKDYKFAITPLSVNASDTWIKTPDILLQEFELVRQSSAQTLETLYSNIDRHNPYKDIPIKIDKNQLYDVLLRAEIMRHCQEQDPNFHVETVGKSNHG